ncbi:MAG: NAD-dependent epimerase/dehydratase family protein [Promethearchaeota archaeon]
MKVLVTGGGGFLGRYIVEKLLERGDKVSIFCRGFYPELEEIGVKVIRGDIRDRFAVKAAIKGHQIVFHVASKIDMFGKYKDFYDINVSGTQNVVDGCIKWGIFKLIYTSSASVVFNGDDLKGEDESLPYPKKYLAPYPKTKMLAEKIVLNANGINGLKTTILRPHLICGPRDPSLAPRLIKLAKKGRLPIIGNGDNKLDITYVENVADAHILAAESSKSAGQIYFISQGEPVVPWELLQNLFSQLNIPPITRKISYKLAYIGGAILEFFFKIFRIRKKEPLITRFLASELSKSHFFDISKAKNELGYEPKISLEEGLKKYVDYYLDHN